MKWKKINYLLLVILVISYSGNLPSEKYWSKCKEIEEEIKAPEFPNKVFKITDFGAIGDNKTLNTYAINKAIDSCSKTGGGIVEIPEGIFITGAIHMQDNVNLHISDNAILKFSTNTDDYLPEVITRWEGVDCYNYSPLIYAYKKKNIAITGKGILDGQGSNNAWWPWKAIKNFGWREGMPSQLDKTERPQLLKYAIDKIDIEKRIFGKNHYLRPQFINFYLCKNILIQDVTIINSPFWVIHPLLSENITVKGVKINSTGPNNDGCDPESSKNILIENCIFNTGDDCIAIKSGRNNDGRKWNTPSENIIIRNCKMHDGHGGVVIGSEITGGCQNVFVENCEMNSPKLDRAIRIKTNNNRGGIIENLFVQNIKIGVVDEAILRITCNYEKAEGEGKYFPVVRNIYISNITCEKAKYAIFIDGIEGHDCVYNINISDSKLNGIEKENNITFARDINLVNVFINDKKQ